MTVRLRLWDRLPSRSKSHRANLAVARAAGLKPARISARTEIRGSLESLSVAIVEDRVHLSVRALAFQ